MSSEDKEITEVSLGSHWGLTGVSLGSAGGVAGVALGSRWGLAGDSLGGRWVLAGGSLGVRWRVAGHSRLREKAPEKNPQNDAFLHPACKAKVSSRLDGSTVSTVSPGPLLGTILASIWATFGYHLGKMSHKWHTSVTQVSHKCHT